ncbi:MAG: hypothetical protein CBB92_07630 [Flammeovirgaceae bacterium TMED32]|nr:hypothetical protein [Rhodospirillaceae bacterium]OUT97976.1 MAG: hypothetical protein CBB92_07630 [Flammeovirgaceae bacterium TMED32]
MMSDESNRLIDVRLDDRNFVARNPEVEHERRVAVYDLLEDNFFRMVGTDNGPYALRLLRQESRLIFEITDDDGFHFAAIPLALSTFRKIIRDYFTVCESYYDAIKTASPSKIEAIDMGRRGLHDEGAELLKNRLRDFVEVDEGTARRLFTLICVLHVRS